MASDLDNTLSHKVPAAPPHTGKVGRRLWKAVVSNYECADHELELLRQAVRAADTAAECDAMASDRGLIVESATGPKMAPWVVEARAAATVA